MFRWTLLLGLVLVLAVVNGRILQTERQLREGELVYLQLAPVDPRSLMQGDYMALNFALANAIRRAEHSGSQVGGDANNGRVIVRLDAQGENAFSQGPLSAEIAETDGDLTDLIVSAEPDYDASFRGQYTCGG